MRSGMSEARAPEQPTAYLIPVASRLHRTRVEEPSNHARELLSRAGLKVFGIKSPAVKMDDIPKFPADEYDAVVIFISSGGTSGLAARIAAGKPYFLWGYDEVNSLPSALSAREKLRSSNAWMGEIVYNSLDEAPRRIVNYARGSRAVKSLRGVKIAMVGEEDFFFEKSPQVKGFMEFTGVDIITLSMNELLKSAVTQSDDDAAKVIQERIKNSKVVEPSKRELLKAAKLFLALKESILANEVDGVTLDCYRILRKSSVSPCLAFSLLNDEGIVSVCEGDLEAAALMMIFRQLSGVSWMGNLVQISKDLNLITIAHCEAPLTLAEAGGTIVLRSHFESDESVGLDVPLRKEMVTVANLQFEPLQMTVANGEVMESQIGKFSLCRTQAMIRLKGSVEDLLKYTGNHHVVAYGDWTESLRCIADRLKISFVTI